MRRHLDKLPPQFDLTLQVRQLDASRWSAQLTLWDRTRDTRRAEYADKSFTAGTREALLAMVEARMACLEPEQI